MVVQLYGKQSHDCTCLLMNKHAGCLKRKISKPMRLMLFFLMIVSRMGMTWRERNWEPISIAVEGDAWARVLFARWGLLKFVHKPLLRSQEEFLHFVIGRWGLNRGAFDIWG